jgi:hypothetical protein
MKPSAMVLSPGERAFISEVAALSTAPTFTYAVEPLPKSLTFKINFGLTKSSSAASAASPLQRVVRRSGLSEASGRWGRGTFERASESPPAGRARIRGCRKTLHQNPRVVRMAHGCYALGRAKPITPLAGQNRYRPSARS